MNADRNWERNEPNERDSRGGPQGGFQFSDAYGPGGGAAGNRVINDIHCKNATFNQQGFPESSQLLPDEEQGGGGSGGEHERGHGRGHGHGRGRGGPEEESGRYGDEPGGPQGPEGGRGRWEHGGKGQWQHGGQGQWEHSGRGRGGHGGHKGHHGGGQEDLPPEDFDSNGNLLPLDANGKPIPQSTAVSADYSPSYNGQAQPIDANYSTAMQSPIDASTLQAPTPDSTAATADPLTQLSGGNPDVAQVLTDAQTQMSPQGFANLSQLMQQNLQSGTDGGTALTNSIAQLQQAGSPDVAALQTVIQTDAPNLMPSASTSDALTSSTLGTTDASGALPTTDTSGAIPTTDTSGAIPTTQSFDAQGNPASDTILAQISQADPAMGQFVGALQQAGMSQSTYSTIENTVAQNLNNGTDDNTIVKQLATSLQQSLQQNPNLQQDVGIFQQVLTNFTGSSDGSGTTSDAAAQSSSYDPNAQYSSSTSAYSTPTSAAV